MNFTTLRPAALLMTLLVAGCGGGSEKKAAAGGAAPPPAEVQVVQVEPRDLPVIGEWVATLDGFVNASIKAQVSGYLLRRCYQEGTMVRKGQLLFELDPRPFEANLAQARGQLAQSQGALAQANSQRAQAMAILAQANSAVMQARAGLIQANGQLLQTQAALEQARANQKKAELDYARYLPLLEKKAVTQQEVDNATQTNLAAVAQVKANVAQVATARGNVAAARAQIKAAEAQVQSANAQIGTADAAIQTANAQIESSQATVQTALLNLTFTRLEAPIDGIAGIATAQVGDLIAPTGNSLTTVSQVNPIKVNFNLPEQEYLESAKRNPTLASRELLRERFRFTLIQSNGAKYPQQGRFYAEDRNVAINTGAIRVTTTFPNPAGLLRPGQYGKVQTVKYTRKNAALVPQRAVTEMQDRFQVAVVTPDNKIDIRTVTMGERSGKLWVVEKGLKGGERVVAEGVQKVQPGAVVKPVPYVEQTEAKQ